MTKIPRIFLVLLISYSLCACFSKQEQLDVFQDSSCDLPCWNGIVVGQTTEQELFLILDNLSIVGKNTAGIITESGVFDTRVSFRLGEEGANGQYSGFAFAHIKDDKVWAMEFVGGFELTFDEITEVFGEPKHVFTTYNH